MSRQQRSKKRLGEILMELGFASPDEVLDGLDMLSWVCRRRESIRTNAPEALAYLSKRLLANTGDAAHQGRLDADGRYRQPARPPGAR